MTHETLASLSNHPEINQVEELIRNLFTQEVKIGGFIRISKMSKNRTIDFFKKKLSNLNISCPLRGSRSKYKKHRLTIENWKIFKFTW